MMDDASISVDFCVTSLDKTKQKRKPLSIVSQWELACRLNQQVVVPVVAVVRSPHPVQQNMLRTVITTTIAAGVPATTLDRHSKGVAEATATASRVRLLRQVVVVWVHRQPQHKEEEESSFLLSQCNRLPPQPRCCSAPSAADGATSSPRSNCDLERRLSNHPAPTPAADGCGVPGGAQGDDDIIGKVTSLSHNTPPIPPQRDQFITKESVFMGEGGELREEGRVSSSRPYDVEPTLMHSHNAHLAGSIDDNEVFPNDAHDDSSRLTLDQLCLKSVEEERLEVSSVHFTATASADLPVPSEQPESCGAYNSDHQSLVRSTSACSGMDSGSSPSGGGDSIAGGGRSGENGSRVVFLQQTAAVVVEAPFELLQHRPPRSITSSSLAMLDVLRTNNPNQGDNSPSAVLSTVDYSPPSNFVFDSAVGVGGGGGGSGGASVHGDPQLGPSMCSSWDSGDCYRARISMADAQSTMQTVATASLFTSRNL